MPVSSTNAHPDAVPFGVTKPKPQRHSHTVTLTFYNSDPDAFSYFIEHTHTHFDRKFHGHPDADLFVRTSHYPDPESALD